MCDASGAGWDVSGAGCDICGVGCVMCAMMDSDTQAWCVWRVSLSTSRVPDDAEHELHDVPGKECAGSEVRNGKWR